MNIRTSTQIFLTVYNLVKKYKNIKTLLRAHRSPHLPPAIQILAPEVHSEWRYYFYNRAYFWPVDTIRAVLDLIVPGSTQFLQPFLSSKK